MQLPRDLAALADVNRSGPAWRIPNEGADDASEAGNADGKKQDVGQTKEEVVEAVKEEVEVHVQVETNLGDEKQTGAAEVEAERAALAAARQRVSIPAPADGQQQPDRGMKKGMGCDVEMQDEGLVGSRFSAEVRQLWPLPKAGKKRPVTQVLVEYDTLFDEDEGSGGSASKPKRLQEWVPIGNLHPVPPLPPDGWITQVCPGDRLEGLYEGGWWAVDVIERCNDAPSMAKQGGQATTVASPAADADTAGRPSAESTDAQHSAAMPLWASLFPATANKSPPDAAAAIRANPVWSALFPAAAAMGAGAGAGANTDDASSAAAPAGGVDEGADGNIAFVTEVVGYDGLKRTFVAADLRPPLGSRLL